MNYQVDAKAIGEGFRPENTDVFVLYNDNKSGANPQGWPIISQMKFDDDKGQVTELDAGGIGNDSYPVW